MAFDIVRDGLRIVLWRLGFAVVVKVIGSKALQCHMRPPSVVPALECAAQQRQVIEPLDERDAFEPFVLERLDEGEAKMPEWSRGHMTVRHSKGYGYSRGGPIGAYPRSEPEGL